MAPPISRKLLLVTLFMLAAFSQLPSHVGAATNRCTVQGFSGACLTSSSCHASGGTTVPSGSCKEDGTACCYKASCAAGGTCKWTDQCTSGTKLNNLCPGPADFQCCVTSTTTPAKPATPAGAFTYVALGDSYAAGLGSMDNYDPASGTCKRSPNAHPKLLANMLGAQLDFKACSGAVVSDVRTQLGSLSDATNLVTLSVGGNDLGFTAILTRCAKDVIHNCDVSERTNYVNGELKTKLAALFTEVKSKAKNARVVVTGYPRLFADQLKDQVANCVARFSDWVDITEMTRLNKLADILAVAMKSAAESSGVEYVDMRKVFDDHAVCDGDAWLNGLSFEKKPDGSKGGSDETAHPNKKGQEAYAKAVMCQIRGQYCGWVWPRRSRRVEVGPGKCSVKRGLCGLHVR